MNAMKFTEIYAALVRDTMQQVRRQTASRSPRGFNGVWRVKILSASVSKQSFGREISNAQILKGEILKANLDR